MPPHKTKPPTLNVSITQSMHTIQMATEYKRKRRDLLREIGKGTITLRELLWDQPDYFRGERIYRVLLAVPTVGPRKAEEILRTCRIPRRYKVWSLRDRHIAALLVELDRRRKRLDKARRIRGARKSDMSGSPGPAGL